MLEQLMAWIGFGLCHQLPERSFFGGSVQVPVCARDTGIYLGFMIAVFILWAIDRGRRSSGLPGWPISIALGLFVVAMGIDGVTSYAGLRETTNAIRLATGLATGFALACFTVALVNGQLWERPGQGRVLPDWRSFGEFLAGLVVTFAAIWWIAPELGVAYPIVVTLSIIFTFTFVNGVVVALLPPFERRAVRARDSWPVFGIALIATLAELAASAALKSWMIALARVAS